MKNWKYIVTILCLFFLGKVQAQDAQWTLEQTEKANEEVELINNVTKLTADQKVLLTDILLKKNRTLERVAKISTARRNSNVNAYLTRIEEVLRFGTELDHYPNQQKAVGFRTAASPKEILTKQAYTDKVLNNVALRKELNLNIDNEK